MKNVCAYNKTFAFTSIGIKIDQTVLQGCGPYVFQIYGQMYHVIGSLLLDLEYKPDFVQLYIIDARQASEVKKRRFPNLNATIVLES
jgi:hypothetical protein